MRVSYSAALRSSKNKPAFPSDTRARLDLLEEHRFGNGVVYLRHRTQS